MTTFSHTWTIVLIAEGYLRRNELYQIFCTVRAHSIRRRNHCELASPQLLGNRPRVMSIRARTPVEVLVMGKNVFTQISGALARQGHTVTVITRRPPGTRIMSPGRSVMYREI